MIVLSPGSVIFVKIRFDPVLVGYDSLEMDGFIVLFTPSGVQVTELTVLVRLLFLRDALLVVPAPQVNQCHVLPVSHLLMN